MKKIMLKYGSAIASFAFAIASIYASTCCTYAFHQPKLPEGVKKLRKF